MVAGRRREGWEERRGSETAESVRVETVDGERGMKGRGDSSTEEELAVGDKTR